MAMVLNQDAESVTQPTLFAGSDFPFHVEIITIKQGEAADLPVGTPMILEGAVDTTPSGTYISSGKYIQFEADNAYAGTTDIKDCNVGIHAILAEKAGDPTSGDILCSAYVSGTFNEDLVLGLMKNAGSDAITAGEKLITKQTSRLNNIYLRPVEA